MPNQFLPAVIQIPSTLLIAAITISNPMVITAIVPTTGANTYVPLQVIKLTVPNSYGMYQANDKTGRILAITGLVFTVNIDSSQFDPFVVPSSGEQPASFAPSGSQNLEFNNYTMDVPFQSLNNIGN
jgi:hypothetical protein